MSGIQGAAAPLGNITKTRNPPPTVAANVIDRYRLQDFSREVLGGRLNTCCRAISTHRKRDTANRRADKVEVVQHTPTGALSFGNLMKCGSVWICPVCSAKIVQGRRLELTELINAAYAQGFAVSMLTLTVPHQRDDALSDTLVKLSHAKRLMQNRKPWTGFKSAVGMIGNIRVLEVTHGGNGWHPHFHCLLIHKARVVMAGFRPALLSMWQDACFTAGLNRPSDEHGINLIQCEKRNSKALGDYIAKFGIDYEMTYGAQSKEGKGLVKGKAPFTLLRDAMGGDQHAKRLFTIYAEAFHGRRQLVYSRGLRAALGLEVELTDDELAEGKNQDMKLVYLISLPDWRRMCRHGLRGAFLSYLAERLSPNDAFDPCALEKMRVPI